MKQKKIEEVGEKSSSPIIAGLNGLKLGKQWNVFVSLSWERLVSLCAAKFSRHCFLSLFFLQYFQQILFAEVAFDNTSFLLFYFYEKPHIFLVAFWVCPCVSFTVCYQFNSFLTISSLWKAILPNFIFEFQVAQKSY